MQKTLTTTALIFAGVSGLMAANNIEDGIGGYSYSQVTRKWTPPAKGSNSVTGVTNYQWNGLSVNLKENARYEFLFSLNVSAANPASNVIPMFNFYFAAPQNSLLFGNFFDVTGIGNRGVAGLFHYSGNVANGDLTAAYPETYLLNSYVTKDAGGAVSWKKSSQKDNLMSSPATWPQGFHQYKIVVEAFKDSAQADKIKFIYEGSGGKGWTQDYNISTLSGISADRDSIVVGYYLDPDGGSISVDTAMAKKSTRTLIETTTPTTPTIPPVEPTLPDPEPSVPEPSAFGLLAGLGAIALAASRRRRSR